MRTAWVGVWAAMASFGVSAAAAAQDADAGARLYRIQCASCHALEEGKKLAGPHLVGLMGRTAGAVEGARYSKALAESGLVWDAETLEAYLADPRGTVPGTRKALAVRNAKQRADIIAYLASLASDEGTAQ